jgi:1-deoxy-D-xylulose 5-phosphate reductoisomerase
MRAHGSHGTHRMRLLSAAVENSQVDSATEAGQRRDIILLGSTGSIGTQAVDIISRNPDRFRLRGIAAGGGNPELLARQALDLGAEVVVVARKDAVPPLRTALTGLGSADGARRKLPEVMAGADAVAELAGRQCDVVLNAVTGAIGLAATLAALESGRVLALANKESLIMGGPLVSGRAAPGQIVPVDSEHSAIAQCLRGGRAAEVSRLVLTASGGPFLHRKRDEIADATPEEALAHPTWNMGPVITVNSATLVNKGLELIEASLLFGVGLDRIEVVLHPQSVVHSMVEFVDGSTLAQASPPDMHLPIGLALAWPDRLPGSAAAVDWSRPAVWEFGPLDDEAFPAVRLARLAAERGGTAPVVYNAVNEECVAEFLAGRLPFLKIVDTIADVLSSDDPRSAGGGEPNLEQVLSADAWARTKARELTSNGGVERT